MELEEALRETPLTVPAAHVTSAISEETSGVDTEPHAPFTAGDPLRVAAQDLSMPVPVPAHVQYHGPVPLTALAAPVLHKMLTVAASMALPSTNPHAPLLLA